MKVSFIIHRKKSNNQFRVYDRLRKNLDCPTYEWPYLEERGDADFIIHIITNIYCTVYNLDFIYLRIIEYDENNQPIKFLKIGAIDYHSIESMLKGIYDI